MTIYAIGDLHLSFNDNIDKPMDMFGPGWENHAERISDAWRELVTEEDIVIIPGDISWGLRLDEALADIEWIHELPGTKIILKGNHDLWWNKINYLNSLYDDIVFLQNNCYYIEDENLAICGTRGWPYPGSDEYSDHDEKIYKRELMRLKMSLESAVEKNRNVRIIAALHYPPSGSAGHRTDFTDMLESYNVTDCVYGHLHGAPAFGKGIKGEIRGIYYRLVAADYLSARPKLIYKSREM